MAKRYYRDSGIRVCAGYASSARAFVVDLGRRPSAKHSLDRIENRGHYSCGKCAECLANGWHFNLRWATRDEQANNTRKARRIEFNGITDTITGWAERLGIDKKALYHRFTVCKWSVEKALTTPLRVRSDSRFRGVGS